MAAAAPVLNGYVPITMLGAEHIEETQIDVNNVFIGYNYSNIIIGEQLFRVTENRGCRWGHVRVNNRKNCVTVKYGKNNTMHIYFKTSDEKELFVKKNVEKMQNIIQSRNAILEKLKKDNSEVLYNPFNNTYSFISLDENNSNVFFKYKLWVMNKLLRCMKTTHNSNNNIFKGNLEMPQTTVLCVTIYVGLVNNGGFTEEHRIKWQTHMQKAFGNVKKRLQDVENIIKHSQNIIKRSQNLVPQVAGAKRLKNKVLAKSSISLNRNMSSNKSNDKKLVKGNITLIVGQKKYRINEPVTKRKVFNKVKNHKTWSKNAKFAGIKHVENKMYKAITNSN